jgi:hypothetical protein
MFRRKFIDRLREKYSHGGTHNTQFMPQTTTPIIRENERENYVIPNEQHFLQRTPLMPSEERQGTVNFSPVSGLQVSGMGSNVGDPGYAWKKSGKQRTQEFKDGVGDHYAAEEFQEGGIYNQMKQYEGGGPKYNLTGDYKTAAVSGTEMVDESGNILPMSPAYLQDPKYGSSVDLQGNPILNESGMPTWYGPSKINTGMLAGNSYSSINDPSFNNTTPFNRESQSKFGLAYPDMKKTGGQHIMPDGTVHPGATHEEYMSMMGQGQMQQYRGGGMYNQMKQYQEGGKYPHDMTNPKTGYTISATNEKAHNSLNKAGFEHENGGIYNQMMQYKKGGTPNKGEFGSGKDAYTDEEWANMSSADRNRALGRIGGGRPGNYTGIKIADPKKKETGGVALPGGTMEPIPGSDAVVFKGATHDQGGIYPDPQTEVEGGGFSADGTPLEGETMDKVTMAKKGGLKDYFFSDHLKEGGMSYANMHKEILAEGGDQSKIDWLAQMQEKAAGRSPNKIQTASSGGARKYNNGGYTTDTSNQVNDNMLAHRYQIIQDIEDGKPIYNEISNNEFVNPSDLNDMGNPEAFLNNFLRPVEEEKVEEVVEEVVEKKKTTPNKKKAVVVKKTPPKKREEESLIKLPMQQITPEQWEKAFPGLYDTPSEEPTGTGLSNKEIEELINTKGSEKDKTLLDRLKEQVRRGDIPPEAYIAGITQLLPAAYSYLHNQPDAEQAGYTAGFTSPIVAERGKGAKLDRVNYNVERAANASDMRGINKFIETSGGGPANIINKMMAYSRKQQGDAKINAAETRANMQIANQEAQLQQQMELNNMQRAQQASMTNAQLIRAEAARMDQIDANNAAARQKIKDDEEFQKYAGIGATASGIAGLAGDSLSYKAAERMARVIGTEGIYDRDKLRDVVTEYAAKNGIPGICTAGTCTEKQINAYITSQNKTKEETKDEE